MDSKGTHPLVAAIRLIAGGLIVIILVTLLTGPLNTIFGAAEDASHPDTPDIWTALGLVWPAIIVIFVLVVIIAYVSRIGSRDREEGVRAFRY